MAVLRPNSVSTGWTDRQFDFTPQSPHPSQMRSLIMIRATGSGARPRLRLRRSSVAHSWSWMRTVTPGTRLSSSWAATSRSRGQTCTPGASRTPRYRLTCSVVTMMRRTPSARSIRVRAGTGIAPVACWPPVIATAELYRSL